VADSVRSTTRYTYEGGKTYFGGDVRDRRFAGFERITKQDALGSTQTYYHQGDTASTTAGEQTDSFALLGKPYREDVLSLASTTLKKTFFRWNAADLTKTSTSTVNTHSVDLETSNTDYLSIASGLRARIRCTSHSATPKKSGSARDRGVGEQRGRNSNAERIGRLHLQEIAELEAGS
jgi:hypothetical protein